MVTKVTAAQSHPPPSPTSTEMQLPASTDQRRSFSVTFTKNYCGTGFYLASLLPLPIQQCEDLLLLPESGKETTKVVSFPFAHVFVPRKRRDFCKDSVTHWQARTRDVKDFADKNKCFRWTAIVQRDAVITFFVKHLAILGTATKRKVLFIYFSNSNVIGL
ncbi:hypothetical protein CDAR_545061 [Caerostris darwini]|uniref:Uncharacterized protein n=1 Tax=Caerostris darwini TaxID=1538125 RepID=A0AAV4PT32_9ARAC|nr:hypothetical protein CDAR_545061 [Caerostris darwini]